MNPTSSILVQFLERIPRLVTRETVSEVNHHEYHKQEGKALVGQLFSQVHPEKVNELCRYK